MRPATAPRFARLAPVLVAAVLMLSACVTTAAPAWTFEPPPATASPTAASSGSAAPSASAGASGSAAAPSPSGSAASSGAAGATINLAATNSTYDQAQLQAPAGAAFHIAFTNNDAGVPHNVQIKGADGSEPFKGSLLTGAASVTYDVPALAAGSYTFSCVVHPTMTGTLVVQ
jgi:plastocyanin